MILLYGDTWNTLVVQQLHYVIISIFVSENEDPNQILQTGAFKQVWKIVNAMKKFNLESTVSHKKLIIPGYVAVMSGKLNEASGWEVLVGPREASGIPKFLKTNWS